MNNPEPFLVIKASHESSLKKTLAKMKSFIDINTENNSQRDAGGANRIGKISDELFEKLQTMCQALQSQLQQSQAQSQEQNPVHEKKSKKRSLPPSSTAPTPTKGGGAEGAEDEETKPKKKKNRKSLSQ
jgi:hypothetical protein